MCSEPTIPPFRCTRRMVREALGPWAAAARDCARFSYLEGYPCPPPAGLSRTREALCKSTLSHAALRSASQSPRGPFQQHRQLADRCPGLRQHSSAVPIETRRADRQPRPARRAVSTCRSRTVPVRPSRGHAERSRPRDRYRRHATRQIRRCSSSSARWRQPVHSKRARNLCRTAISTQRASLRVDRISDRGAGTDTGADVRPGLQRVGTGDVKGTARPMRDGGSG